MKTELLKEIEETVNNRWDLISRLDAIFFLKECGYNAIVAIKATKLLQSEGFLGRLA